MLVAGWWNGGSTLRFRTLTFAVSTSSWRNFCGKKWTGNYSANYLKNQRLVSSTCVLFFFALNTQRNPTFFSYVHQNLALFCDLNYLMWYKELGNSRSSHILQLTWNILKGCFWSRNCKNNHNQTTLPRRDSHCQTTDKHTDTSILQSLWFGLSRIISQHVG